MGVFLFLIYCQCNSVQFIKRKKRKHCFYAQLRLIQKFSRQCMAISRFLQFIGRSVLALPGWATIVLVIVVIVPASYYVWRAHQPLSMPEYNGLTYNQFTEWRMLCKKIWH
jgi:hypothetical protein